MGPVYGLDTTLDGTAMAGIETNPMENGEASKGAIYGVADYAWNTTAYNPVDNWTRSFSEIMPGAPDAYATFAIHSCDPQRITVAMSPGMSRHSDMTIIPRNSLQNLRKNLKK